MEDLLETQHGPNCTCLMCLPRKREKKARSHPTGISTLPVHIIDEKDILHVDEEVSGDTVAKFTCKERVAQWLMLRASNPDITQKDAAETMGISKQVLSKHINTAVRQGWLKFNDPLERIEYHIIPKVINNLEKFLDEGDKTVTIEAAKGTIFKHYQEKQSGGGHVQQTVLALKIETTNPDNVKITTGTILGKPKEFVEGEIKDSESPAHPLRSSES